MTVQIIGKVAHRKGNHQIVEDFESACSPPSVRKNAVSRKQKPTMETKSSASKSSAIAFAIATEGMVGHNDNNNHEESTENGVEEDFDFSEELCLTDLSRKSSVYSDKALWDGNSYGFHDSEISTDDVSLLSASNASLGQWTFESSTAALNLTSKGNDEDEIQVVPPPHRKGSHRFENSFMGIPEDVTETNEYSFELSNPMIKSPSFAPRRSVSSEPPLNGSVGGDHLPFAPRRVLSKNDELKTLASNNNNNNNNNNNSNHHSTKSTSDQKPFMPRRIMSKPDELLSSSDHQPSMPRRSLSKNDNEALLELGIAAAKSSSEREYRSNDFDKSCSNGSRNDRCRSTSERNYRSIDDDDYDDDDDVVAVAPNEESIGQNIDRWMDIKSSSERPHRSIDDYIEGHNSNNGTDRWSMLAMLDTSSNHSSRSTLPLLAKQVSLDDSMASLSNFPLLAGHRRGSLGSSVERERMDFSMVSAPKMSPRPAAKASRRRASLDSSSGSMQYQFHEPSMNAMNPCDPNLTPESRKIRMMFLKQSLLNPTMSKTPRTAPSLQQRRCNRRGSLDSSASSFGSTNAAPHPSRFRAALIRREPVYGRRGSLDSSIGSIISHSSSGQSNSKSNLYYDPYQCPESRKLRTMFLKKSLTPVESTKTAKIAYSPSSKIFRKRMGGGDSFDQSNNTLEILQADSLY